MARFLLSFTRATFLTGVLFVSVTAVVSAANSSVITAPPSCEIPIGAGGCSISMYWRIDSPTNPSVAQNGTVFSTEAEPSTPVSRPISYGANLFELFDGGTLLTSQEILGICASGSTWNGNRCAAGKACDGNGICQEKCGSGQKEISAVCPTNALPVCCGSDTPGYGSGSGLTCTDPPINGSCELISKGCTGSQTKSPSGSCNDGRMCCVGAAPGAGSGPGANPGPNPNPGANPGPSAMGSLLSFDNPLVFTDVNALVCAVLNFFQGLIVVLALIFIIVGGFLYIISGGDEGRLTLGKKSILGALIGLAIGIAAPMLLREIANLLGWTGVSSCSGFGSPLTLLEVATKVLDFLLSIVGVAALIMLVVGAFMYLTAAGDESRIDTGKSIVKYSVIGIVVALIALVLVKQVATFFL